MQHECGRHTTPPYLGLPACGTYKKTTCVGGPDTRSCRGKPMRSTFEASEGADRSSFSRVIAEAFNVMQRSEGESSDTASEPKEEGESSREARSREGAKVCPILIITPEGMKVKAREGMNERRRKKRVTGRLMMAARAYISVVCQRHQEDGVCGMICPPFASPNFHPHSIAPPFSNKSLIILTGARCGSQFLCTLCHLMSFSRAEHLKFPLSAYKRSKQPFPLRPNRRF